MNGLRVEHARDGAPVCLVLDRPKGNVVTSDVIGALRTALRPIPAGTGVKLITLERQDLDRLMRTDDALEDIATFIERRTPQWRNA